MNRLLVCLGSACLCAISLAQGVPKYHVREFPSLFGYEFSPQRINNLGTVIGLIPNPGGSRLFSWSESGAYEELQIGDNNNWSIIAEINDAGLVGGSQLNVTSEVTSWKWSQGQGVVNLASPYTQQTSLYMQAMNNSGEVVVIYTDWDGYFRSGGYYDANGNPEILGEFAYPYAINDNGRIVGASPVGGFIKDRGQPLQYTNHWLTSINNSGWSVGLTSDGTNGFTVLHDPDGIFVANIGGDGSGGAYYPRINDHNWVISGRPNSTALRFEATLWTQAAGLHTLDSLLDAESIADGWVIRYATDFNNRNQILAVAYKNGIEHKVLLEPVPEPATFAALALGLVPLLRRRKEK